jgi:hypothetical protein
MAEPQLRKELQRHFIACAAHKKFMVFASINEEG